jgi:hypothetical protein
MGLEAEMRASRVVCRVESARLRSHDFELDALELLGFRNTPLLYDMSSESVPQFGILPAADISPAVVEGVFLVHSGACGSHHSTVRFALLDYIIGRKPPALPWPNIGHLAKWSVSSFKFGFGPECLQDEDPDTFWQLSVGRRVGSPTHDVFLALMVHSPTL